MDPANKQKDASTSKGKADKAQKNKGKGKEDSTEAPKKRKSDGEAPILASKATGQSKTGSLP